MRREEYKVSIILPVYNGEKYLAAAIKSILHQTYRNLELIIVDDCSTDESSQIAKSYAETDRRIRIFRNRKNVKLPRSLNNGFRVATGDLFTWTSDDNILKPDAIEAMVDVFEKNSNVDFVYADIIPIDENGEVNKKCHVYLNGEIDDIYVFNPVLACFLYKRTVHERLGGYNPKLFLCEDYDFWVRTYESGFNMYHLKKRLYFYRVHNNSLTANKQKEHAVIKLKLLCKNLFKENRWVQKKKILSEIHEYVKLLWQSRG